MNVNTESSNEDHGRPQGVLAAGGILDRIVDAKALRVGAAKERTAQHSDSVVAPPSSSTRSRSFFEAISKPGAINIIAEIKRRSPSKGVIREDFDAVAIAESYAREGAAALSVLTEEDFFGGSLEFLSAIRKQQPSIPLLRKDFIFDEFQLAESKSAGADAVLLITAILSDGLLKRLIALAGDVGLDALVEVHTRIEMERAVDAGARIIGVNNRDLIDFSVTLDTSLGLAPTAPKDVVLVSESGIATGRDVSLLKSAGFNAFLVGEHFMRAPDPGSALQSLIAAAEIAAAETEYASSGGRVGLAETN